MSLTVHHKLKVNTVIIRYQKPKQNCLGFFLVDV